MLRLTSCVVYTVYLMTTIVYIIIIAECLCSLLLYTLSHDTVQCKYFMGHKFCGFVKILILLKQRNPWNLQPSKILHCSFWNGSMWVHEWNFCDYLIFTKITTIYYYLITEIWYMVRRVCQYIYWIQLSLRSDPSFSILFINACILVLYLFFSFIII